MSILLHRIAIQTGNPLAIASAANDLNKITQAAASVTVPGTAGALQTASADKTAVTDATAGDKSVEASPGLSSLISSQFDAGAIAYTNAKNAGATEDEALRIAALVSDKGISTSSMAGNIGGGALGTGITANGVTLGVDLDSYGNMGGGTNVSSMTIKRDDGTATTYDDDIQEITHTFNKTLYGVPGTAGYTGDKVDQYAIGEGLPFKEGDISQSNAGQTTNIKLGDTTVSMPTWGAQLIGITSESIGDLGGALVGAAEWAGLPEDSALSKTFKKMETVGQDLLGKEIMDGRKDIVSRIDKAEGWEKIPALWEGIKANPGAAVSYVGKELPQEFLMLGAAASVQTLSFVLTAESVPAEAYGTAAALVNMVAASSGGVINPIFGLIVSETGHYQTALWLFPALSLTGLLLAVFCLKETIVIGTASAAIEA